MRIVLAVLPWHSLHSPSLAVALLHGRLRECRPADQVVEYHGQLRWSDFLLDRSNLEFRPTHYTDIAEKYIEHGLGDWIFSGELYGDEKWGIDKLVGYADKYDVDIGAAVGMRQYAAEFVDLAAAEILAHQPEVVGFTSTFMQNVPSLAVAKRLKQMCPELVVVFGGANCDGPMGHALHRNHPFVDYVVRGEGELTFPELLTAIERGVAPAELPGVCWWDADRSAANPVGHRIVPPALIPMPDYDQWFAVAESSVTSEYLEPTLVLEGSRGCWWGAKHQCTFCGLNGSTIEFRSQPAERFWAQLQHMVARYRILDFVTADNIMDPRYFDDLLPRMAASDWDLRVHFEVKANVRVEQVAALAAAGVRNLQPGIESLSDRVLDLMDKGATGAINVRLLRDCEDNDITVAWNYLYGFPGEAFEDYLPVIDQLPALCHLQPPAGASRIALNRFSPYFDQPALGFSERTPSEFYQHVYQLPEHQLADLVYAFDTPATGISGSAVEQMLLVAIDQWREAYSTSRLLCTDESADRLVIVDDRELWPRRSYVFAGWQRTAYLTLATGRSVEALCRRLATAGHSVTSNQVEDWLADQTAHGLLFRAGHQYVALANRSTPVSLSLAQDQPSVAR